LYFDAFYHSLDSVFPGTDEGVYGDGGSLSGIGGKELVEQSPRQEAGDEQGVGASTEIVDQDETPVAAFGGYRHVRDEDPGDRQIVF